MATSERAVFSDIKFEDPIKTPPKLVTPRPSEISNRLLTAYYSLILIFAALAITVSIGQILNQSNCDSSDQQTAFFYVAIVTLAFSALVLGLSLYALWRQVGYGQPAPFFPKIAEGFQRSELE